MPFSPDAAVSPFASPAEAFGERRIVGGAASADSVESSIVVGAEMVAATVCTVGPAATCPEGFDTAAGSLADLEDNETGVKGVER